MTEAKSAPNENGTNCPPLRGFIAMKRNYVLLSRGATVASLALWLTASANAASTTTLTVSANFAGLGQGNGYSVGSTTGFISSESDANGGVFEWQNATFTQTITNPPAAPIVTNPTGVLQAYPNPVYTTGSLVTPFPHSANDFISFCIQINQNVSFPLSGPYAYTISQDLKDAPVPTSTDPGGNPMGPVGASLMEELWYDHMTSYGLSDIAHQAGYALDTRADAGAFQMLIWKLTYDGSTANAFNPDVGNITLPTGGLGTDAYIARQWLAALKTEYTNNQDTNGYTGPVASLVALESGQPANDGSYQDQVAEIQYSANLTIPEPSSVVVWSLLGLVVGIGTRRVRRNTK
jgi:hypothetical protein